MSLATQLRRYALELAAVIGLILIAAVVGGYILSNQRLRFPWEDVYEVRAEFATAQAVTPGQGQTIAVAGVTVGEVKRVDLEDGRAVITFEIDRDKLPEVRDDARMLIRPKTGLQDMSVQLEPGTPGRPALDEDDVLPVARTLPNVNLDEVLAGLDSDTRRWLQTIMQAGSEGMKGRAEDLRAVFKASAPTLERTARVTDAIVARRGELKRLVGNLRLLAEAGAEKDDELRRLISASDETFGALAAQDGALRDALSRLPGTLDAARDALAATRPLSRRLPAAAAALRPALRELEPSLPKLDPLLRDARPAAARIRRLTVQARPVLRSARPALRDLRAQTPDLSSAFRVLNYVNNELAHNPEGPEEGFLFWTAWFFHNANGILTNDDAHGVVWRGGVMVACSTFDVPEQMRELLTLLFGSPACPKEPDQ